jgi:hypothetical protein
MAFDAERPQENRGRKPGQKTKAITDPRGRFVKTLSRIESDRRAGVEGQEGQVAAVCQACYPQAHLTNRMIPTNAQLMSKSKRMPPAVNPTKANLPTAAKTKAQPNQAHQGKSDGLINIAAHYMLGIGPRG